MWTPKKAMDRIHNDNIIKCDHCGGDGLHDDMKTCTKCDGMGSYARQP